MSILCLGITFRNAPIELRELLSLEEAETLAVLHSFREGRQGSIGMLAGVREEPQLVILSTCNRLELYFATSDESGADTGRFQGMVAQLCAREPDRLAVADVAPYLVRYENTRAVHHLCRVAAGLDSMVLGESQILGQVSDAFDIALRAGTVGPELSAAFRAAIHAGKRAQTETAIGQHAASVGSVAVRLAEQVVGQASLAQAQVLVVGAGEMAELVIKALRARGVSRLGVSNRTHAHALALAERWGGDAFDLEQLEQAMQQADMIITSTGAPHPIIPLAQVQRAMHSRPDRPLILIDIAVPRDIDPAAGSVHGVRLFNLDDLQAHLDDSLAERQGQVPRVEAIVSEELAAFEVWLRSAQINPVISDLRRKAEAIRQGELDRALRHLPDLDPRTRDYIQGLSRALVNKLLHEPTSRLRAAASDERGAGYAESVRYLFGLNGSESSPAPGAEEL